MTRVAPPRPMCLTSHGSTWGLPDVPRQERYIDLMTALPPPGAPPPLDCPGDPLGHGPDPGWDDHERTPDLRGLLPVRKPGRTLVPERIRRSPIRQDCPARRLARRRIELALRSHVAPDHARPAVCLLPHWQWGMALPPVSSPGRSRGHRNDQVLPPAAQRAPGARQTQSAAEARVHLGHPPRRARGAHGVGDLQADPAFMVDGSVRRIPGGAVLALLDRMDLRRLQHRARAVGVSSWTRRA